MVVLNQELIEKQWLTSDDVAVIKDRHELLRYIKNNPKEFTNPVELIEGIEFELQELWKFEKDRNYHTHWFEIKGCRCSRLDSLDALGTGLRYIMADCPWHGWKDVEQEEKSNVG